MKLPQNVSLKGIISHVRPASTQTPPDLTPSHRLIRRTPAKIITLGWGMVDEKKKKNWVSPKYFVNFAPDGPTLLSSPPSHPYRKHQARETKCTLIIQKNVRQKGGGQPFLVFGIGFDEKKISF